MMFYFLSSCYDILFVCGLFKRVNHTPSDKDFGVIGILIIIVLSNL